MPWSADVLRPLIEQLLPVAENLDVESLKKLAAEIGPEAVSVVAEKAPWNPLARETIKTSAPAVAAKWLNKTGISAENAPEVALGIALAGIVGGRLAVKGTLEKMAEEARADRESRKEVGK